MSSRYARIPAVGALALILTLLALLPASVSAAPPTASINATTGLTFTTAQTSGKVNPQGKEATYRFEVISDELYDDNVAGGLPGFADATQVGFGFLGASAGQTALAPVTLEGLTSGVRYHLRLVAENEDGLGLATAPDFVTVAGQPAPEEPISCLGDSCQALPPEPVDPALGTLVPGLGNPKVHYFRYGKHRRHKNKKHRHRKTRR